MRRISSLFLLSIVITSLLAVRTNAEPITIMAFGDSLTAGYRLATTDAFPAQLEVGLKTAGYNVKVLNAGISGDTTSGGLSRLDWALGDDPRIVILELGANDALRGLDPAITAQNLDRMIAMMKDRGVSVLLAGMLAPPNMGPEYGKAFNNIFPELADKHDIDFYPFFLDGVAANAELNQIDGMHPTADGVKVIVERILPSVTAMIDRLL